MIAYLKGVLSLVTESYLVIDVNGVGYQVFITSRDAANLPARGEELKIYTWMSVTQDSIRLYGFLQENDLEIFKLLINVSGVGPKAALGILSSMTADDLRFAVLADDAKSIARAPGIGSKSAQKVILELKDKFSLEDAFEKKLENSSMAANIKGPSGQAVDDALQALVAMGYSSSDALRAVRACTITDDMDSGTILGLALKEL